jgi:glucuronate isomerase
MLPQDRLLGPAQPQKSVAQALYKAVADLPIISPHGHVAPSLFADDDARFGSPVELLITPDHYVFRMLYAQGVPLTALGVGEDSSEIEPRAVWQTFAEHFYLFRGTPTGLWLRHELEMVFGVEGVLTPANAQAVYDRIDASLQQPDFTPRALYERFNIEVLATTDAVHEPLTAHHTIAESGWGERVIPTFRPDDVTNLQRAEWTNAIQALGERVGYELTSYARFIEALEQRRTAFAAAGATATDHGAASPATERLSPAQAEAVFQRALAGQATAEDAARFTAHMLMEMARMSTEDGLVMQLHVGAFRNHNRPLYERYGPDMGADIPLRTEFTRNLRPLLNAYGNTPNFRLIVFTLDEAAYARELAPLAGHYPAMYLGPPWWFHDSPNGMRRYFDRVMETAGLYNTVGFNDDTRAFLSIPARHDVWRRVSANWLAGLVCTGRIDEETAVAMLKDMASGLARRAYNF